MLGATVALGARARTLDRVVASVGEKAITASDLEQEFQFERFLEGLPPVGRPSRAMQRTLLNRLISRTLLQEDMRKSGIQAHPPQADARRALAQIQKRFGTRARYDAALKTLGMSETEVLKRLETYQETLAYIDRRFQPVTPPSAVQIRTYYESVFVPQLRAEHRPPPPLAQVEAPIREILVQKELDQRLNEWLKEMRSTQRVHVFGNASAD